MADLHARALSPGPRVRRKYNTKAWTCIRQKMYQVVNMSVAPSAGGCGCAQISSSPRESLEATTGHKSSLSTNARRTPCCKRWNRCVSCVRWPGQACGVGSSVKYRTMNMVRNPFELAGPRGEDDFLAARTPRCEDIPAAGDGGKSEKARKCARQDREPGRAPAAAAQKIASSMTMWISVAQRRLQVWWFLT